MLIGQVRAVAAAWVRDEGARTPGFLGAYLAGSTVGLPADAPMPESSDVDIMVVLDGAGPLPPKPGKLSRSGVLLEVSYVAATELASPEQVLASYHVAHGLRVDTIVADPEGWLRPLQAEVAARFAESEWVRRRVENVLDRITTGLGRLDVAAPLGEQVTAWLFPTAVTAHVPLVAALRNPTVRLRYLAAREVLTDRLPAYEGLLRWLGCAEFSQAQVTHHLARLAATFDAATACARTRFFFSSDITPQARVVSIDGSRDLIAAGWHREAVFWIAATFARCHTILAADAPDAVDEHEPALRDLLAELGVATELDRAARAAVVIAELPALRDLAESLIELNVADRAERR